MTANLSVVRSGMLALDASFILIRNLSGRRSFSPWFSIVDYTDFPSKMQSSNSASTEVFHLASAVYPQIQKNKTVGGSCLFIFFLEKLSEKLCD